MNQSYLTVKNSKAGQGWTVSSHQDWCVFPENKGIPVYKICKHLNYISTYPVPSHSFSARFAGP